MRTLRITKRFRFDAAHFLEHHDGKCVNIHGHTYTLDVTIEGEYQQITPQNPSSGMIMDFGALKEIVKANVLDGMDHELLNDHFLYPTAEVLAVSIFNLLENEILPGAFAESPGLWPSTFPSPRLVKIRLYETPDSWAEVSSAKA